MVIITYLMQPPLKLTTNNCVDCQSGARTDYLNENPTFLRRISVVHVSKLIRK